ncbi:MAG TPA: hypothetical protein VG387_19410 [Rhizomicrobium sp.]|jgi:hypothetical protein|nr:hypothetical protein [Rhizomicrobium sp.]
MGIARLLAKGWIVFCLYAGAQAVNLAFLKGTPPQEAVLPIAICVLLFGAMGLLFATGFGASAGGSIGQVMRRMKPSHFLPSFDAVVFILFVIASFAAQAVLVSAIGNSPAAIALQKAIFFVVPGEPALNARLYACRYPQPLIYSVSIVSSFTWLLAIVYVGSAVSRIALTAGLLRLERALRPSSFGPTVLAALYFVVAIVVFQLLYMGSAYAFLPCRALGDVTGSLLIGLAPLMLAYLIVAAAATLKASAPEAE